MMEPNPPSDAHLPHVVIVGGGFGGLAAAKAMRKLGVRITLVDRTNYHLFQPLLYQVAMAGLSPADVAVPIRSILSRQHNVRVLLAEVVGVDLDKFRVDLDQGELSFDYLVLAVGSRTTYFGHDEWAKNAPGLKNLDDALGIRRRVLLAFERAEREPDPWRRKDLLRFVIVGGGPTGVELAGAIAELARHVLAKDFRAINPRTAEIILLEGGTRILSAFDEALSASAKRQLEQLGVTVRANAQVSRIDEQGVWLGDDLISSATVIWSAGVRAETLCQRLGVETDRSGRARVGTDLALPGHPRVFAVGDMAHIADASGIPLPGISPVAIQMGRHAARVIAADLRGQERPMFRYVDRGTMATIGRKRAIAQLGRWRLSGLVAWIAWLVVHIYFLIGFRNRLAVILNWAWSYFTYQRGARLINEGRPLNQESSPDLP